jgi:hypothetical protein
MGRCTAISRRSGTRCKARTLIGKNLCAMHDDPDRASCIGKAGGAQRGRQLRKRRFTLPEYDLATVVGRRQLRKWLLHQLLRAKISARDVFAATAILDAERADIDSAAGSAATEVIEATLTVIGATGETWDEGQDRAALRAGLALASGADSPPALPMDPAVQRAWEEEHARAGFGGPPGPAPLSFARRSRAEHGEYCPPGCQNAH